MRAAFTSVFITSKFITSMFVFSIFLSFFVSHNCEASNTDSAAMHTGGGEPLYAPTLIYPENNAEVEPLNITFKWQHVETSNWYYFTLFNEYQDAVYSAGFMDTTKGIIENIIEQLAAGKKYYWEVNAENDSGIGPRSERWEFTTAEPSEVGNEAGNNLNSKVSPNPSSDRVEIKYEIQIPSIVNISIYNHLGQLVKVLADGFVDSNFNSIEWNTQGVENGTYFYRIQTGKNSFTGKIIVLK